MIKINEIFLPCKKYVPVTEDLLDAYDFLGMDEMILEACLHYCPDKNINGDVNSCQPFLFYAKNSHEFIEYEKLAKEYQETGKVPDD